MLKFTNKFISIMLLSLLSISYVNAAETTLDLDAPELTTTSLETLSELPAETWIETDSTINVETSIVSEENIQEFKVINKKWTIEITKDTILVWTTEKNTSIIDLFSNISIDWKSINESILSNLDVRYVTPDKKDFKITTDTDIIDLWSEVYVLFKTVENGWTLWINATVDFELKNFELKDIWNVSETAENSYNKIYNVVYSTEELINTEIPLIEDNVTSEPELTETPVIDNTILEENNTWIKDNILLLSLAILLLMLSFFVRVKKN